MIERSLAARVAALALAVVALSGCAADPATEAVSTSFASAQPTPTLTLTKTALVPGYDGVQTPAGKPVTAGGVSYLQSTISDTDPAMFPKPEAFDASTAVLSQEDLQAAVATVVKFTAEESIDSTLNGEYETPDQWWVRNEGRFHPDYKQGLYDGLAADQPFVMREKWHKQIAGYKYLTAADQTRIHNRYIEVNSVRFLRESGTVVVAMDVSYEMLATPGVGSTGTGIQKSQGKMVYSVTQDASRKWLIDGFTHQMKTTPG